MKRLLNSHTFISSTTHALRPLILKETLIVYVFIWQLFLFLSPLWSVSWAVPALAGFSIPAISVLVLWWDPCTEGQRDGGSAWGMALAPISNSHQCNSTVPGNKAWVSRLWWKLPVRRTRSYLKCETHHLVDCWISYTSLQCSLILILSIYFYISNFQHEFVCYIL